MLKKFLKSVVPNSLKYRINMGPEIASFAKQMDEIERSPRASAYIIGTPIHTNLGDHLITLAEYEFINSIRPTANVKEIPTEMFRVYKNRLKKAIPTDIQIYINGGGWMGNLWPIEELLLQEIIDMFSDHKIVVFPQTIYFEKGESPYDELVESANLIYKKCKDITLCTRDRQSYEFAVKHYKNVNILLVPDIALAYYDQAPKNKGNDKIVGYCLREDRELFRDTEQEKKVKNIFSDLGYTSKPISTMYRKRVSTWNRKKAVNERFEEFSSCSFVVTDRLHGMIFSFLTQTPCVVFDNKTRKVSGVYNEWLKDSQIIFPVFSNANICLIESFISKNCETKHVTNKRFTYEDFSDLKEKINGKN